MTNQIKRFSGHQTAKVFSILFALGSLPFVLPMLLMSMAAPSLDEQGNAIIFPTVMFALIPFFYLLFGYVSVRVGCWLYNVMYKFIGGIEFELVAEKDAS